MKVVLLTDVKSQGKKNDVIEVSDGYARNYLIPRKLAVEADSSVLNAIKGKEEALRHKIETEPAEAKATAARLESLLVKIHASCGADGRLYGSITSKEIAERLEKDHGISVDKRKIQLSDPIRAYGQYDLGRQAVHRRGRQNPRAGLQLSRLPVMDRQQTFTGGGDSGRLPCSVRFPSASSPSSPCSARC